MTLPSRVSLQVARCIVLYWQCVPPFRSEQVVPRPVLSVLPLQVPVVNVDSSAAQHESDVLLQHIHLNHLRELEVCALLPHCSDTLPTPL